MAASLLFDGHILASAQIANSVAALLCDAGAQRDAFDERGLRPTALEELLRWSPAITLGMPRTASVPLMLDDGVVEAGQTAVVAFGLVNRDPDIFEHPELLDLRRESNKHLAFGYGMHYCLGSHLARLELAIALTVLFSRLPGLTLDIEERDLTWSASHTIRRLLALPVTWQSGTKPAGSVR